MAHLDSTIHSTPALCDSTVVLVIFTRRAPKLRRKAINPICGQFAGLYKQQKLAKKLTTRSQKCTNFNFRFDHYYNLVSQAIWHPRKYGIPTYHTVSLQEIWNPLPTQEILHPAWTLNFLGHLEPNAKFPRISGTPCKIS